jgi:hypothetical protein
MKALLLSLLWAWGSVHAQATEADDVPARIAAARAQLQQQRETIELVHEERRRECWQRFAVNDCLREVRRSRYQALDPLRPQELELNAQEREWRTRQRDERLRNKQDAVRQP